MQEIQGRCSANFVYLHIYELAYFNCFIQFMYTITLLTPSIQMGMPEQTA